MFRGLAMFKKGINNFSSCRLDKQFAASGWVSFAMSDDEHVVTEPPRDSIRGKPGGIN